MISDSNISQAKVELEQLLKQVGTLAHLEDLRIEFLGRKGRVNQLFEGLKKAPVDQRKSLGQLLNQFKTDVESSFLAKQELLSSRPDPVVFDHTLPGDRPKLGHLHPTTQTIREINSFFHYYGFSVYDGPEIETNEFNFEKLNLPLDHPARDLADTLYIRQPHHLLRTHTSSVETRALSKETLPIKILVPGKVYRNETSNSTNNSMFYQYEGLYVDRGVTMAHLKATLVSFVKFLYGPSIKTRFRCKYYPQVEPGAGLDVECTFCGGKACQVCKYRGFVEVLGAGMVHPNLLKSCDIDPKVWSGFAFGLGLDRLVMLKHGIDDIRKLYNNDLVIATK